MIPSQYTKFIVPLIGAALTAFIGVTGKGSGLFIGLTIAVAVIQAFATLQIGNSESGLGKYAKFWVNVAGVLVQGILALVGPSLGLGDVTAVQWAGIALAVVSALGVVGLPNAPELGQVVLGTQEQFATGPGLSTPLGGVPLDGE